jgi:hypothetical protein
LKIPKGVIRSYLSKDRQYTAQKKNDKKDKQRFTKEYTEMNKYIAQFDFCESCISENRIYQCCHDGIECVQTGHVRNKTTKMIYVYTQATRYNM